MQCNEELVSNVTNNADVITTICITIMLSSESELDLKPDNASVRTHIGLDKKC